jgi:hypothetical protein
MVFFRLAAFEIIPSFRLKCNEMEKSITGANTSSVVLKMTNPFHVLRLPNCIKISPFFFWKSGTDAFGFQQSRAPLIRCLI